MMNAETKQTTNSLTTNSAGLKRRLDREAVDLALNGQWERAAEVNRGILELCADDVEAMNRLAKALIELGAYADAKEVLDRVYEIAPYNNITEKNRTRLEQLGNSGSTGKHSRKSAGAPQLFIEESGKSGTTVLHCTPERPVSALVSPGDAVNLVRDNNTITAYSADGEYLGQLEPRMGKRLAGLIQGGNTYAAAVIGTNAQGTSVIIRETFRHRSLHNVCSFTSGAAKNLKLYLDESVARFIREEEPEDEDDEEELETGWTENE